NLKLSLLIVIATIQTGLIGIFFKDIFEGLFQSPVLVASMLTATAALLWTTRFAKNNNKGVSQLKWWHAVILGVAQGAAIVPGISRSGTTISVALLLGVERELAARFSFLMAIPAILGALVLQLRGGVALAELASLPNILGFVAAGAVGIGALALLIPLVRKGQLHYFAFYLIPLSLGSILWLI
ncbi:undecaprenyl-diphosphate phosphatase, partial [Myxococcota bacterium]|nr:undecaprenyl-diphosphate phosphatase [Myxococcota bacterium]